jgi:hypothetical protein
MMHANSLGRAARYYLELSAALGSELEHATLRELHDRAVAVAAALNRHCRLKRLPRERIWVCQEWAVG